MDYPKTWQSFQKQFSDEESCRIYLQRIRWPEGFHCPGCGSTKAWRMKRRLFLCPRCRRQVSATAGTIFEGSHLSLQIWFHAIWWLTAQKSGVSALGLQRVLGLGSYRSAWMMLHKLRCAMVCPDQEGLKGEVEVDESFLGGPQSGKRGRGAEGKQLILIAAERNGRKIGRIRMKEASNASAKSLQSFIKNYIQPGSKIVTDQWRGYSFLRGDGYRHEQIDGESIGQKELLPRVHRVASLLKRWLLGTHHGKYHGKHLKSYLNEFTFRFNRRTSRFRGLLFYRILQNAVQITPTSYRKIVAEPAPIITETTSSRG